ncbi:cyclic-di-AMP-binding protein CbpB [Bacillus chungangensis]|uniref:Transcriptional regulator n=1 Tax=Bacillus chungangensis TaxID=587633 RepID=A0ABT9WUH9_9BACI|nr:cyclic-di-AMP-binding protein CbpB [Bacillus chungangensis]MDQ0176962.1 putative transcriptional regulator [Bacillus chungangensis]
MVSVQIQAFLESKLNEFIIPSEKVAHVQLGNSLEHALLVLTKSGYSSVPVLDAQFKLHGLISSAMITESILGLERIEFEKLSDKKVEDVMTSEIPRLLPNFQLEKMVDLLVNHPFICVEDHDGFFEGIVTRRALLKQLNRQIHKLIHLKQ